MLKQSEESKNGTVVISRIGSVGLHASWFTVVACNRETRDIMYDGCMLQRIYLSGVGTAELVASSLAVINLIQNMKAAHAF